MWLDVPACENGQQRRFITRDDLENADKCLNAAESEYKDCGFSSKRFHGRLGIYRTGLFFRRAQLSLKTLSDVFSLIANQLMPDIDEAQPNVRMTMETPEHSSVDNFFISHGSIKKPDNKKLESEIKEAKTNLEAALTSIRKCCKELKHTCLEEKYISTKFQTFLESYCPENIARLVDYSSYWKRFF